MSFAGAWSDWNCLKRSPVTILAAFLLRRGSLRGWCRYAVHRSSFHQLRSRAVRIVEVQLSFAIATGSNFHRSGIPGLRSTWLERLQRCIHVWYPEADVMSSATLIRRRHRIVQHELDVVV